MILYFLSIALFCLAVWMQLRTNMRQPEDVADDLLYSNHEDLVDEKSGDVRLKGLDLVTCDDFSKAGIYGIREKRLLATKLKTLPICCAVLSLSVQILLGSIQFPGILIYSGMGAALGYIISRYKLRALASEYKRSLEFNLPVVMERLVMAVQAGHHLLSALENIVSLERKQAKGSQLDPVTTLLEIALRLTVAGMPFNKSTKIVSNLTDVSAVRHAFVHLGVAHEQGGDLISPLKELSEATQQYYQESIEEHIAKLPIKATMPLLCTFLGMIIMFITPQILRIMNLANQMVGK